MLKMLRLNPFEFRVGISSRQSRHSQKTSDGLNPFEFRVGISSLGRICIAQRCGS